MRNTLYSFTFTSDLLTSHVHECQFKYVIVLSTCKSRVALAQVKVSFRRINFLVSLVYLNVYELSFYNCGAIFVAYHELWWRPCAVTLWRKLSVDLWFLCYKFQDMNEPVNFVNGATEGCPSQSSIENPPYVPGTHILEVSHFILKLCLYLSASWWNIKHQERAKGTQCC